MDISECIDRAVKAQWRAGLVNLLTDAGRTLEHTALRINGSAYKNINVGLLLLEAARSLQECQDEAEPENPGDVVVKVTAPDRWLWEAGANQIDSTRYGDLANCAAGRRPVMGVKDLIERMRDAGAALDGSDMRIITRNFDSGLVSDLLLSAAAELEKGDRPRTGEGGCGQEANDGE